MISDIGVLIAAYVGFRILEILAQGKGRYQSRDARITVIILGVIALLVIGVVSIDLMLSGATPPVTG